MMWMKHTTTARTESGNNELSCSWAPLLCRKPLQKPSSTGALMSVVWNSVTNMKNNATGCEQTISQYINIQKKIYIIWGLFQNSCFHWGPHHDACGGRTCACRKEWVKGTNHVVFTLAQNFSSWNQTSQTSLMSCWCHQHHWQSMLVFGVGAVVWASCWRLWNFMTLFKSHDGPRVSHAWFVLAHASARNMPWQQSRQYK